MPLQDDATRLLTYPLNNLASGWHPFAPQRAADPENGLLWQRLTGLRWQDGVLEMRRALDYYTDVYPNATWPDHLTNILGRDEFALYLFQIERNAATGGDLVTILVTSSDIHVYDSSGTWVVATPQYTTGTISYVDGSDTVTGVGTAWADRKITPENYIFLDGNWHEIGSVTNNTSLELADSPLNTSSGESYVIRRSFGDRRTKPDQSVYARMFNGVLYVAGPNVGGLDQPAVAYVNPSASASPVALYLTSSEDLTGTLDEVSEMVSIGGLEILEDGRVVIVSHEDTTDDATDPWLVNSRIRWSSHLDRSVWTSDPAGFTDVTAGGAGAILSLDKLGRDYALHYRETIVLATLTGQDTPPLLYRRSQAHIGSAFYRTVKDVGGVQWFVGADMNIYKFDGRTTQVVTTDFRDITENYQFSLQTWSIFAEVDTNRNEYIAYFIQNAAGSGAGATGSQETQGLAVNMDTGETRWEPYPMRFFAVLENHIGSTGVASGTERIAQRSDGTLCASLSTTFVDDTLFLLRENMGLDDADVRHYVASPAETIEAVTLPLDWGFPGSTSIIERIELRMKLGEQFIPALPVSDVIRVSISSDQGDTWLSAPDLTFTHSVKEKEIVLHAIFDEYPGENWKLRFRSTNDHKWVGQITRIIVKVQIFGEEEAQDDL